MIENVKIKKLVAVLTCSLLLAYNLSELFDMKYMIVCKYTLSIVASLAMFFTITKYLVELFLDE